MGSSERGHSRYYNQQQQPRSILRQVHGRAWTPARPACDRSGRRTTPAAGSARPRSLRPPPNSVGLRAPFLPELPEGGPHVVKRELGVRDQLVPGSAEVAGLPERGLDDVHATLVIAAAPPVDPPFSQSHEKVALLLRRRAAYHGRRAPSGLPEAAGASRREPGRRGLRPRLQPEGISIIRQGACRVSLGRGGPSPFSVAASFRSYRVGRRRARFPGCRGLLARH
jgi:hypothetical protein